VVNSKKRRYLCTKFNAMIKNVASRTKIIATLGPASRNKEVLKQMILAGLDSVRINCSHTTHEQMIEDIKMVREVSRELGCNVAIIADLQGPKIRIGNIKSEGIEVKEGDIVEFTVDESKAEENILPVDYSDLAYDVEPGEEMLIDDGKLKLIIVETDKISKFKAKVIYGGKILPRKGINLPKTDLSLPSMTDKDIDDAIVALENGVDWIALSFVRRDSDVIELKHAGQTHQHDQPDLGIDAETQARHPQA
jgi:pyruvate kinase